MDDSRGSSDLGLANTTVELISKNRKCFTDISDLKSTAQNLPEIECEQDMRSAREFLGVEEDTSSASDALLACPLRKIEIVNERHCRGKGTESKSKGRTPIYTQSIQS